MNKIVTAYIEIVLYSLYHKFRKLNWSFILAPSIYRYDYYDYLKSLPNYAMKLSIPLHCHGKLINVAATTGLHYYWWLCQKLNKREFIICFLLPCKIWIPRINVSNQMKLISFKCLVFAKYFTMRRKLYLCYSTFDKLSQKLWYLLLIIYKVGKCIALKYF